MKKWWNSLGPGWRGLVKTSVSAITSIVIANLADPTQVAFSWPWCRHILIAMFCFTLVNESRYIKEWADTPEQGE